MIVFVFANYIFDEHLLLNVKISYTLSPVDAMAWYQNIVEI